MTTSSNAYCAVLGIRAPRVEDARSSPDANYYSLLLVALLERGEPMTLEDVAVRLAAATATSTRLIPTTMRSASGCFALAFDRRARRR